MERKKNVKKKKEIFAGELPPDVDRIEAIMKSVEKMREVLDGNMDELAYKVHLIPGCMLKMVQAAKEIRDFSVGVPETYEEIVIEIPLLSDVENEETDAADPEA